jgi:hypothetical protein
MKITDAGHPWAELIKRGWVMPTHIISIRQPWAHLVASGQKDIENRTWKTNFRGRVLVHASQSLSRRQYDECIAFMAGRGVKVELPAYADIPKGGIVGEVEIVDCVTESRSKWFEGDYGFVLRQAKMLPFVSHQGQLGIRVVKF